MKKAVHTATRIYDRASQACVVGHYSYHPLKHFWWPPSPPKSISAGALRRLRNLVKSERYGDYFYHIRLERNLTKLEERGGIPPRMAGGPSNFLFWLVWKQKGGNITTIKRFFKSSTPWVIEKSEELGLIAN